MIDFIDVISFSSNIYLLAWISHTSTNKEIKITISTTPLPGLFPPIITHKYSPPSQRNNKKLDTRPPFNHRYYPHTLKPRKTSCISIKPRSEPVHLETEYIKMWVAKGNTNNFTTREGIAPTKVSSFGTTLVKGSYLTRWSKIRNILEIEGN